MLAREIRQYIQEPILNMCGWSDPASHLLIYGTGYIESEYQAVIQHGAPRNGGIGFYQQQPSDYLDQLRWFKNGFAQGLLKKILTACNFDALPLDPMHLAYNSAYSTLMCRIHYHRIKQPLPPLNTPDTPRLFAEYHFKFYNGNGEGKTDVDQNTIVFNRIINNEI
jgi:hypothetical protein